MVRAWIRIRIRVGVGVNPNPYSCPRDWFRVIKIITLKD
jgi:hypothetical protein